MYSVIALVALNAIWFGWVPNTSLGNTLAAKIFSESGKLHNWTSGLIRWRVLEQENIDLKSQLASEVADTAERARLKRENEQLRSALSLSNKTGRDVVPGGIFNVSLAPDGYMAMINKGVRDNVAVGDIVVADHNVLVGIVRSTFPSSSKISLVSDPSFKVTVQVLGGEAKGIAKGFLDRGMFLDLVVQSDEIKEGDTLVSSGDDMFPAGLIVGVVSGVEDNKAKLFKEVFVRPAGQFVPSNAYIIK